MDVVSRKPKFLRRARLWVCASAVAALFVVGVPGRASADQIGIFGYDVDPVFGPLFSVENDSADAFTDVTIDLFAGAVPGAEDLVTSLALPDVEPFGFWQTLDDLTTETFASAALTFIYGPAGSVTTPPLTTLDFTCDAVAGCSTTLFPPTAVVIDFVPNQGGGGGGGGTQVPEPPTWALLGAGLAVMALAAGRRGWVAMR